MKKSVLIIVLGLFILSGCSSTGVFSSANLTNVELSEGNYEIVAKNVTGQAQAAYLFGISGSFRNELSTFALVKLEGSGFLYQDALTDFWNNFEERTGTEVEGRRLAIVNVRYDSDVLNLFVYTRPKVAITADVVEFE